MKHQRLMSRVLLFTVLVLCLSLSPIVSAQKIQPRKPTTQRQETNQASQLTAQACCSLGNWNLATHLGPGHRTDAAMAYDSARHRVVLFGGYLSIGNGGALQGDTWEWDGNVWAKKATTGPSAREDTAMAYDATRGRVVLFGGSSNFVGDKGDTWEWDGTTWTLKANGGPAARGRHAMAYDSGRGKVILYGGQSGPTFADTWEWNGTVWTLKATTGPGPRVFHALADDSARGRVVLNGGANAETWEWDGVTWTKKAVIGPPQWTGAPMAFSTNCGKVMRFSASGTTWQWDGVVWTNTGKLGPSSRVSASMAYDSFNQQLVLFGGYPGATPYSDETWTINMMAVSADFQLSATSPSGNSTTYQVTATNAPLGNGVSFWWQVEEIDVVTGAVVPNMTVTNPSAWWANPTTNVFSGYYNNSSPIGVFYQGHKYRISHGVWNSCNPWIAVSKTVFMCITCRRSEMKDVPSIKTKPKIGMQ
jgi:hypothetical protein